MVGSRRRVAVSLALLLTLAAACEPPWQRAAAGPAAAPPLAPTATPGPRQPARVVRVVDGDTIIVEFLEQPGAQHRVRYLSVNAPESVDPRRPVECFGREASAANQRLVGSKLVLLEKDVTDRDRFDRLLRYIWLEDGVLVNAELVRGGYAMATVSPPDLKYRDILFWLERQARAERRGMFGKC